MSIRPCAYQGVRNIRFSEKLACFVFFPVLRFALLPYYRRSNGKNIHEIPKIGVFLEFYNQNFTIRVFT